MDIEATIEDLEAQAYFASIGSPASSQGSGVVLRVHFNSAEAQISYLSWPLLGRDFIAGFDAKSVLNKPTWQLIPFSAVQSIEGNVESNALFASELLESRLLGSRICIRHISGGPTSSGILTAVMGDLLSLQLASSQVIHFPFSSLRILVVEKLNGSNPNWA